MDKLTSKALYAIDVKLPGMRVLGVDMDPMCSSIDREGGQFLSSLARTTWSLTG
jgi:hypothetical protein